MAANPWLQVPDAPPYVLASDQPQVDAYNARARDDFRLHVELLPEPFLGNPDADVVLLNLNPGFAEGDPAVHLTSTFIELCRSNLRHERADYPFFFLNPALDTPGSIWWRRRLSPLVAATSLEAVARRVLCVEFFPYHSRRFAHGRLRLPSQDYGFQLVRNAMTRDVPVVIMRSRRLWIEAVPELQRYDQLFDLRSVQNVTVSRKNCPEGFEAIIAAVA